ncbi:DNA polymerase III subunit gamma/tau [Campylobacter sp. MG1]|uniref:DNA polymerase III subunit gamma/tau n=1 Tax=Campylobacter sp. MG1 TaxID=2976332 RepID=UPI00226CD2D1|nr:DNA polymerase III subunit gamma/tau [Campylobacter sp. MG1]
MNNMQNLSLKYRPKNYDDLVGQSAVSKSLKYALDSKNIANAYLFSGLRGSGKTSSARILAKALNCERGISSKPCGMCASCVSNDGIDIYELDAASNRGIDSIQDLIENTKYAPLHSRFKIFIIDEVHMLTREAFNALLKTLEEPPSHVKFILATTDPNKLPATILSRVLHFRFKKIPLQDIVSRMEFILTNEQIPYEKEALNLIARSGGGSMRDSLTLLEQGIIYSQKRLSKESIALMLGLIDVNIIRNFFNSILNSDESGIFKFLELAKSYEIETILDEMSAYLKDCFYSKNNNFSLLLYDRFFHILAKAKNMAKISDDDDFILCVMSFMLKEAVNLKSIDEKIDELNEVNDNEKDFNNFVNSVAKRDYKLGEILKNRASFVSFDGNEYCIKVNPENEDEKQHFRTFYSSVIKPIFTNIFNDAKLVIKTDIVKNDEVKKVDSSNEISVKNNINYQSVENEIRYPEYQSDDYLDDLANTNDYNDELDIPDEVMEKYDGYLQDLLIESICFIKIEDDILCLYVNPPVDEQRKGILRNNILKFLKECQNYYKIDKSKIININEDSKKKL